jgi:CBS domain-containing protein
MQVNEVMSSKPLACQPTTNLAAVTKLMWEGDCGTIPVTDATDQVIGMITDRDICIALGTRNRAAAQIRAEEVISGKPFVCRPNDDVRKALATMKKHRVHRLPVVDADGKLLGVLSVNDIVLATGIKPKELTPDDVVSTFKALCEHRPARVAPAA